MLKKRHLIEPEDLTIEEMDEIFELTKSIINSREDYMDTCRGKILASLFYEPSTRTRLSFESAMIRLGGEVIGFSELGSSSVAKGESLKDTIKTVAAYSDIIAMRHPKEGAPRYASSYLDIPLVNAGDGGHQHPTQTLTDLYTIEHYKGRLDNMTIGLCGDLKFGRTVHSLIKAMSRYSNVKFIFISPNELKIPNYLKEEILDGKNIDYQEVTSLRKVIPELDVLYMTRVQKERFFNEEEYIRLKDSYLLNQEKLDLGKENLIVMHPLPRVTEIDNEIDDDKRAVYFQQVENGMYVRMALILKLLGVN